MRKRIGMLILVLAMLMGMAMMASAAEGQLQDGGNVMELPWKYKGEVVYTYTATQTGTLYITATDFSYSFKGGAYEDNSENMSDWSGTTFTVDGKPLQHLYYGSVQVTKGKTYTFSWSQKFVGNFGWKATIDLRYSDEMQPKQGSLEAPVKLRPQDCPTDTVQIEAGDVAYYELWDFEGACLCVSGENAFVEFQRLDPDTMETVVYHYAEENGMAVAPIDTSLITVKIGNDGDEAAVYQLTWFYPEGTQRNPKELAVGENIATTKEEDYEGFYFVWTAPCEGNLTVTFPETGWMYSLYNQTTGEQIENVIYGDSGVSNVLQLQLSSGEKILLIVNSFKRSSLSVPGGDVVITVETNAAHRYGKTTVTQAKDCVNVDREVSVCEICGYENVVITPGPHSVDETFAGREATCVQEGMLPYWHCKTCDTYFADEALSQATTEADLRLPTLEHSDEISGSTEGSCVIQSTTTFTCTACGRSYTEEGALDENMHGATEVKGATEAGCTTTGYTGDTCCSDCGKVLQIGETIPVQGHNYICTATTAGSCVAKSTSTYTCNVCQDSYTEAGSLDPETHGQTEQKYVTEVSCTTDGYTGDICCVDCGKVLQAGEKIPALGHDLVCVDTVVGTCVVKSSSTFTCNTCGYRYVEMGALDEENHAHVQNKGAMEESCLIDGYTGDKVCTDCGMVLEKGQILAAKGHDFEEWTLSEDGRYRSRECSACGYEETEDLGCQHRQTQVIGQVEASCSVAGYSGDLCCVDCGKVMQAGSSVPAWGHDYVCTETIAGTCTVKSVQIYTCSVCGDAYTEAGNFDPEKHGQMENENATDATCTADGYTGDICCGDCGAVLQAGERILAQGHQYVNTAVTVGTCVVKSATTFTCDVCGHSYVESGKLDENNHIHTQSKGQIAATCLIDGYSGDQVCADCGVLLAAGQVLPATGHGFGEWVTTADGHYRSRVCANCGHEETEDLGCQHGKTQLVGAVEATCATAGYTGDTCCVDCGKVMQAGSGVPAKGHSYACTATTVGTCVVKSTSTYTCSVCNHSYTEAGEIDAQAHSFGEWVTADDGLSMSRSCVDCGVEEVQQLQCKHAEKTLADQKDATCVTAGFTGNAVCTVCGEIVAEGQIIAATGHSFGAWTVTQAPTATEEGFQVRQCANCDAQEQESIPATGEVPEPSEPETKPTEPETNPTEPAETEPSGNTADEQKNAMPVVIIVVVAVVGIAVAAVVIGKKKK